MAGSSAVRQSKTIVARLFYGSLKSPTCSYVSITLPAASLDANHGIACSAAMFGVAAFGGIGGGFGGKGSGGGFGLGGVGLAGFGLLGIATTVFLFNIQSQQAGNV